MDDYVQRILAYDVWCAFKELIQSLQTRLPPVAYILYINLAEMTDEFVI
jgi:hypothetical protein